MALNPGTRLGPYEIAGQIGAGGMGEVYRATDTNLKRQVAIKVLPEAVAGDAERLARFQREAEVLGALNHPNIAAIYGIETGPPSPDDGLGGGGPAARMLALVLELVEGPTLADRIAEGPVPVDEALPIAKQIAEALEVAHEQGIVHRDLKPANVKVRPDGTVKVLDFGLAKAMDPASALSASGAHAGTMSPTITTPAMTQAGLILGTAAYMSPEQAKGRAVDARADVWAFGAVLFEMLSGRRAFDGEDMTDVLGAVVRLDPDWSALPATVPERVTKALRVCLLKDPRQRAAAIHDVRLALEGAFETTPTPAPSTTEPLPARWWSQPRWVAALVVTGVLAGLGAGWSLWVAERTEAVRPLRRFSVVLPDTLTLPGGDGRRVAISPDGQTIVYRAADDTVLGRPRLYQRRLDDLTATAIPGTDGARQEQFFSPDGTSIAFFANSALMRVSLAGGSPTRIAQLPVNPRGGSWGDGFVVVGLRAAGLGRIADTGGEVETLTTPAGGSSHYYPQVLPGGRGVLFTEVQSDAGDARVLDLQTGETRTLVANAVAGHYTPSGHLVFLRDGDLWAVTFDLDTLTAGERPALVEQGIRVEGGGAVQFAVADDGSLAYIPGGDASAGSGELIWVDAQGQEEALQVPARGYRLPRVSPDGTKVAVEIAGASGGAIWLADAVRGSVSPVTSEDADNQAPLWTPDGKYLVYSSARDGAWGFYRRLPDGTGEEELLGKVEAEGLLLAGSFSPDGDRLVFLRGNNGGIESGVFSMKDGTWEPLVLSDGTTVLSPMISPDGQWIAYASIESGQPEVYLRRFPDLGGRETISLGGGLDPGWSPDGRTLYYRAAIGSAAMMSVSVEPGPPRVIGTPRPAFDYSYFRERSPVRHYDIAPDGRFVVVGRTGDASAGDPTETSITVVQDWFSELRRLVPVE